MKISNFKYLTLILALGLFTACGDTDPANGGDTTNQREFSIADYIIAGSNSNGGDYNVLYAALVKANLVTTLESGTFTLLAPSDDAFAAIGVTDVDDISVDDLTAILNYHVIGSALTAETLTGRVATAAGTTISVSSGIVNGIAEADFQFTATNGSVFQLDAVLEPPVGNLADVVADNSDLSLVLSAATKAGLDLTGTTNLTLFLPDNDAMSDAGLDQAGIDATAAADILAVLNYHIIEGDFFSNSLDGEYVTALGDLNTVPGLTVSDGEAGGADIVDTDNIATNGVIHILDDVITPPSTMADALGPQLEVHFGYDFLIFDGLLAGMQRVNLDDTYLSNPSEEYSIYGPCCNAFDESSYPVDADLIAAIEAHIFEGVIDWNAIGSAGGTRLTSVGGDEYVVTSNDAGEFINGVWFNAFGAGSGIGATTYNGVATNVFGGGPLFGLPSESITDQLDGDGSFALFSAALKALDATATGDYTVFAIDDATFTAEYGYSTVVEVEGADADEFEDLLNHLVPGFYWAVDIADGSLPTLSASSENDLVFSSNGSDIGVLVDPSDLTYFPVLIGTDVYDASNGVIHQVDAVIAF